MQYFAYPSTRGAKEILEVVTRSRLPPMSALWSIRSAAAFSFQLVGNPAPSDGQALFDLHANATGADRAVGDP